LPKIGIQDLSLIKLLQNEQGCNFFASQCRQASPSGSPRDKSGSRCPQWRLCRRKWHRNARCRTGQVWRRLVARSDHDPLD